MQSKFKILRVSLALTVLCAGFAVFAEGAYLETRNPRTNDEDMIAWSVLWLATSLIGMGASMPFVRWPWVIAFGIFSPGAAFVVGVAIYWGAIISGAFH